MKALVPVLVVLTTFLTTLALLPRTPRCNTTNTRKAWIMTEQCVSHGGEDCWGKTTQFLGCKAL